MGRNLKFKAGTLVKLYSILTFFLLFAFSLEAKIDLYEFRLEAGAGFYYASMYDFNNKINELNQTYEAMGLAGTLKNINILLPYDATIAWIFGENPNNIMAFYISTGILNTKYESSIYYNNKQSAYNIINNLDLYYLAPGFRKYFSEYKHASGFNPYLGVDFGVFFRTGDTTLVTYYSDGAQYSEVVTPGSGLNISGKVEIGCDIININWPNFTLKTGYRYVSSQGPYAYKDIPFDFSGFYILADIIFGAP